MRTKQELTKFFEDAADYCDEEFANAIFDEVMAMSPEELATFRESLGLTPRTEKPGIAVDTSKIAINAASLCEMAATRGVRIFLQSLAQTIVPMLPAAGDTDSLSWREAVVPLAEHMNPDILRKTLGWVNQPHKITVLHRWDPATHELLARVSVARTRNKEEHPNCKLASSGLLIGVVCGEESATATLTPRKSTADLVLSGVTDDQSIEIIALPLQPTT